MSVRGPRPVRDPSATAASASTHHRSVQEPPARGVRCDQPEQRLLVGQHRDVADRLRPVTPGVLAWRLSAAGAARAAGAQRGRSHAAPQTTGGAVGGAAGSQRARRKRTPRPTPRSRPPAGSLEPAGAEPPGCLGDPSQRARPGQVRCAGAGHAARTAVPVRVRHVIADERGQQVGHTGQDGRESGRRVRGAAHEAPHPHAVIAQVRRARAAGPASAQIASRSCSAADTPTVAALPMHSAMFRGPSPDLIVTEHTVALDEPPASTPATPPATPSRRAPRSAAVAAA
jgi:hypothetical protein